MSTGEQYPGLKSHTASLVWPNNFQNNCQIKYYLLCCNFPVILPSKETFLNQWNQGKQVTLSHEQRFRSNTVFLLLWTTFHDAEDKMIASLFNFVLVLSFQLSSLHSYPQYMFTDYWSKRVYPLLTWSSRTPLILTLNASLVLMF